MILCAVLVGLGLSRCVERELLELNVAITATSTEVRPGPRIGFGENQEDCYLIRLSAVNNNAEEDVANNKPKPILNSARLQPTGSTGFKSLLGDRQVRHRQARRSAPTGSKGK